MREINSNVNTTVFTLLLNLIAADVKPTQAFQVIKMTTDETADDLIPELAHCAKQARNGMNAETHEYMMNVLKWAMQN